MTGLRRSGLLLALVLLAGPFAPPLAAQPHTGETPEALELRAEERALAEAMHRKDGARIDAILAPDYVLRGVPDIDRATWMRNALTLCWGDDSDIDSFAVRRVGTVAVATFVLTFYADPASCAPAILRSLITDVWVRDGNEWRLQVRHAAPPPAGTSVAAQYGVVPLPPPTWEVGSELSLVATGGSTSTRTVGLGGTVTHRDDGATTRASVAFLNSATDSVTRAQSLNVQVRHGVRLGPRAQLFAEGLFARDRFAGIDTRGTVATGIAFTTRLARHHSLIVEGGGGYVAEQRLDATRFRFATANGAVRYRWAFTANGELSQDTEVIGDVEEAGNWRGSSVTAVRVALNHLLSLRASHAIEYRRRPVVGFSGTDSRTAAALVLSLQRRPPVH